MQLNPKTYNLKPHSACPERSRMGFTLVEVLVSVVILALVITAIASIETGNIKIGTTSKYTIQANGLGQEGVNLVKSLSDKASLNTVVATGGDCLNPNDKTTCPPAVYYLKSDNSLKKCTKCRPFLNGVLRDEKNCSELTLTDTLVCTDSDNTQINNQFYRTVIIPN